jgi:NADH-quinone oxidoreductase subunit L
VIGAVAALVLGKVNRKLMNLSVVLLALLSCIMTLLLMPTLFIYDNVSSSSLWFTISGGSVGIGLLIDPLSIIIANIVSFLGFLIMLYSYKYMEADKNVARFWFFMSLFLGSMLLLVLADNFILMFIGWKLVGVCSFGLIGFYYRDQKERWIGGPAPFPFQKPSRNALKSLLVTSFGDVALLGGIIILYIYAHTFNFLELISTTGTWLPQMAATPGILSLTCILLLMGPLSKSAQFPFHEWLPEAMSGPTPVSALIHAATMVKAGVYLIARMLPIFFIAAWAGPTVYPEALTFFIVAAVIGAFSAFLAGTQAIVAKELKKVLAYSTMSAIGYMILALGVSGLSADSLVVGTSSSIFFLLNHGIFKVILFLGAGVVIHASGTIYLSEMNLPTDKMKFTWIFMWIGSLSLMGVFPLSGFWSKDNVLMTCLESGQYLIFIIALISIVLTSFYAIRMMGLVFHTGHPTGNVHKDHEFGDSEKHPAHAHGEEAHWIMLAPYALLAILTVVIGLVGPLVSEFLSSTFKNYYINILELTLTEPHTSTSVLSGLNLEIATALISTLMIIIGAIPAYKLYIVSKSQPEEIVEKSGVLRSFYKFLWNRWYIDAFYNKFFVQPSITLGKLIQQYFESPLDHAINDGFPRVLKMLSGVLRKVQTGKLRVNMLYVLVFLVVFLIVLWLGGFI